MCYVQFDIVDSKMNNKIENYNVKGRETNNNNLEWCCSDSHACVKHQRTNIKMKISVSSEKCKWKSLFLFCCYFISWSAIFSKIPLTSCQITTLVNENTTLLHPIINATQAPTSNNTLINDLAYLKKLPWWCTYSNDLEEVRILSDVILDVFLKCINVINRMNQSLSAIVKDLDLKKFHKIYPTLQDCRLQKQTSKY